MSYYHQGERDLAAGLGAVALLALIAAAVVAIAVTVALAPR